MNESIRVRHSKLPALGRARLAFCYARFGIACCILPSINAYAAPTLDAPSPPSSSADQQFRVLDGDEPVGTFVVRVLEDGMSRTVVTTSQITIKRLLLKATVDRRIEERWSGDRFVSLSADFRSTGTLGTSHKKLDVSRNPDGTLEAVFNGESHSLPEAAVPMTFWGPPVLREGIFFDATKGGQVTVKMAPAGDGATALTYEGQACEAKQVRTEGAENEEFIIWLTADGSMRGLRQDSALADLRYVRE